MKLGRAPFRVDSNFLSRCNENLLLARGTLFARLASSSVAPRRCHPTRFVCCSRAIYTYTKFSQNFLCLCLCFAWNIVSMLPSVFQRYRDVRSSQPAHDAKFCSFSLSDCRVNAIHFEICESAASERVVEATSRYAFKVPSSSKPSLLWKTKKERKKKENLPLFTAENFRNELQVRELLGRCRFTIVSCQWNVF